MRTTRPVPPRTDREQRCSERGESSIVGLAFKRFSGHAFSGFHPLDVGDDLIQRLSREEHVSLGCMVTVAGCELVDESDRIDGPKFSVQNFHGSLGDLGERFVPYGHGPISWMRSRGLTTFGGPSWTALVRLSRRSSQVRK